MLVSHGPDLVTVLMEGTTLVEVTILVEVPEQISNLDILFKDTKKSVISSTLLRKTHRPICIMLYITRIDFTNNLTSTWKYLVWLQDSAYFLGSTVTTIGFGDILPEVGKKRKNIAYFLCRHFNQVNFCI